MEHYNVFVKIKILSVEDQRMNSFNQERCCPWWGREKKNMQLVENSIKVHSLIFTACPQIQCASPKCHGMNYVNLRQLLEIRCKVKVQIKPEEAEVNTTLRFCFDKVKI